LRCTIHCGIPVSCSDFSNNNLKGVVSSEAFYRHRKLSKIDLSRNKFNGFADVLIAPAITYVNYSHNEFTSLGHILKSRQAYNKIEAIDLGQNLIYSQARDFFTGLPPGLKKLNIRDNELIGSLPTKFTSPQLAEFDASNNLLTGVLPDLSESITKIEVLKLSRQKISGSIPPSMSSLLHLVELDLSSNGLTASIPPTFGNIPLLKLLNLSNNELTGSIDGQVGKLSAILEVFDVSNNRLEGRIPETMKDFVKGQILLGGNDMLCVTKCLSIVFTLFLLT
jgi:Leucine-rich repeat (LRR) protein